MTESYQEQNLATNQAISHTGSPRYKPTFLRSLFIIVASVAITLVTIYAALIISSIDGSARSMVVKSFLASLRLDPFSKGEPLKIYFDPDSSTLTPLEKDQSLLKYSITNAANYPFKASNLTITRQLDTNADFAAYEFTFQTLGKLMTGQINIPSKYLDPTQPNSLPAINADSDERLSEVVSPKIILLIRGYIPAENYTTGDGTRHAAAVFAQNGYVTIAPDFLGVAGSDKDFENNWESRFSKPIQVIELLKSIENTTISWPSSDIARDSAASKSPDIQLSRSNLGIWAHSNGGQITLTTLEILQEPIPATLWAPMVAPFPYSILFFSDTDEDEGKLSRKDIALLERDYDVFDFGLRHHLDRLQGPLQLHQGSADTQVLKRWTDELEDKIKAENKRRKVASEKKDTAEKKVAAEKKDTAEKKVAAEKKDTAEKKIAAEPVAESNPEKSQDNSPKENSTSAAAPDRSQNQNLEPIEFKYFVYPGANHNLQPNWDQAMARDLEFFERRLE